MPKKDYSSQSQAKPKPAPKQYASKSAHDKLRAEFEVFKADVQARLGIDPNAPARGEEYEA